MTRGRPQGRPESRESNRNRTKGRSPACARRAGNSRFDARRTGNAPQAIAGNSISRRNTYPSIGAIRAGQGPDLMAPIDGRAGSAKVNGRLSVVDAWRAILERRRAGQAGPRRRVRGGGPKLTARCHRSLRGGGSDVWPIGRPQLVSGERRCYPHAPRACARASACQCPARITSTASRGPVGGGVVDSPGTGTITAHIRRWIGARRLACVRLL